MSPRIINGITISLLSVIYEVINGIVIATKRRRLASDKALEIMGNLMELGAELKEVEPGRVLELALRYEPICL